MTWRKLEKSEQGMWCTSEGCWGIPTQRLEVDGIGSNHCANCRHLIEMQQPNYKRIIIASVDGL